ncbi:GNAT family N-acetyltransferase [Glycomyces sp. NPDC046736]|uniref:GNAT family N-acetyltransferase n=1 Tax=Glycomyces sp. NPDC046736 TaxID=3155615 RepID=UPI0033F7F974
MYDELFAPSFPAGELEPASSIAASLDAGEGSLFVAVDEAGEAAGAAFGRWSAASRIQLLTYLAVHARTRGAGLGGRLLGEAVAAWAERYAPCAVVAEIESPDAVAQVAAHGDPRRRLAFYRSAGAKVLDLPYFQPGIGGPEGRIRGMLLLVLHADTPFTPAPDRFAGEALRAFLTEYLEASEGDTPTDAEAAALLEATDRPGGVPLE